MTRNLWEAEREKAAKAMRDAGYTTITADKIEKSQNLCGVIVYVAVTGNAMVIYTPGYWREPVQLVNFR